MDFHVTPHAMACVWIDIIDDVNTEQFNTILQTFDMVQHVAVSTHDCGSLLDVVVTGVGETPTNMSVEDVSLPDHSLISWSTDMSSSEPKYINYNIKAVLEKL